MDVEENVHLINYYQEAEIKVQNFFPINFHLAFEKNFELWLRYRLNFDAIKVDYVIIDWNHREKVQISFLQHFSDVFYSF